MRGGARHAHGSLASLRLRLSATLMAFLLLAPAPAWTAGG
jgi:hypothetical protein